MQLQYWPTPDYPRTACMHAKTSCKSLRYTKSMSLCEVKKKKKVQRSINEVSAKENVYQK